MGTLQSDAQGMWTMGDREGKARVGRCDTLGAHGEWGCGRRHCVRWCVLNGSRAGL